MALPASGQISLSDVNVELSLSATATISMNDTAVRTVFGQASGAIDMNTGHGKSNMKYVSLSTDATNQTISLSAISGYVAGSSKITITVGTGVYIYSTSTSIAALTITGGVAGDQVTLINNGFILGMGGNGADAQTNNGTSGTVGYPIANGSGAYLGFPGGPALSINYPITIDNTNGAAYIAGGGGGGHAGYGAGGGGGAGGGKGGSGYSPSARSTWGAGGVGGGPGQAGTRADNTGLTNVSGSWLYSGGGGGGGRILPGVGGSGPDVRVNSPRGGSVQGFGGGAGGGAGSQHNQQPTWNNGEMAVVTGGSGNSPGHASLAGNSASGGGGWGAAGGAGGNSSSIAGAAGGKAVALNGNSVTWVSSDTTRVYGAVS